MGQLVLEDIRNEINQAAKQDKGQVVTGNDLGRLDLCRSNQLGSDGPDPVTASIAEHRATHAGKPVIMKSDEATRSAGSVVQGDVQAFYAEHDLQQAHDASQKMANAFAVIDSYLQNKKKTTSNQSTDNGRDI